MLGDRRATLAPDDGGRLAQLDLGRGPLLRPRSDISPDDPYGWTQWGSFPLAPWSNRIAGGRFTFDGHEHRMPVNFSDGTAIHGLVAATRWAVVDHDASTATLRTTVDTPPYRLAVEQRFVLHPDGLDQTLAVTNDGQARVPVGLGIHPWLRSSTLRAVARSMWPAGDDGLPTGPPVPVDADHDLSARRVPPPMDTCFTDLGRTDAMLDDVTIAWSDDIGHLVVFTGVTGWTCVEPITNANDAFNLDSRGIAATGTRVLAPGATTSCRFHFLAPAAHRGTVDLVMPDR